MLQPLTRAALLIVLYVRGAVLGAYAGRYASAHHCRRTLKLSIIGGARIIRF